MRSIGMLAGFLEKNTPTYTHKHISHWKYSYSGNMPNPRWAPTGCSVAVLDPEATGVSELWSLPSGSIPSSWWMYTFSGNYGTGLVDCGKASNSGTVYRVLWLRNREKALGAQMVRIIKSILRHRSRKDSNQFIFLSTLIEWCTTWSVKEWWQQKEQNNRLRGGRSCGRREVEQISAA